MAFSHINIEESSTITAKAATITVTRNSTAMHQELVTLADPVQSSGVARVLNVTPPSTEFALVTRPVWSSSNGDQPVMVNFNAGFVSTSTPAANSSGVNVWVVNPSTIITISAMPAGSTTVTVAAMPAGSTSVTVTTLPANSSKVEVTAMPAGSTTVTVAAMPAGSTTVTVTTLPANSSQVAVTAWPAGMLSSGAPSSGSSGVIVRQVWDTRLTAASTNALGSVPFTINSSVAGVSIYVTAYSMTSTAGGPKVLKFKSSNTVMWPVVMAAVSSAISGANLACYPYLFKSKNAGEAMTLDADSSLVGFKVAVSYFLAP